MDMTITVGAVSSVAAISGFGLAIMSQLRKNRRENDADRKADHDDLKNDFAKVQIGLTERITKLETTCVNFMPRAEIEAKIDHEKGNRQMADEALSRVTDRLSDDVRSMMVTQGRIEQQQLATSGSVNEVKETLKEFRNEIRSEFTKMGASISSLTSGHRVRGNIDHD